jgi:hypothetical protein
LVEHCFSLAVLTYLSHSSYTFWAICKGLWSNESFRFDRGQGLMQKVIFSFCSISYVYEPISPWMLG